MTDIDIENKIVDVPTLLRERLPARRFLISEPPFNATSPNIVLFPIIEDGEVESVVVAQCVALLRDAHPHVTFWAKEALPARFHYANNRRIAPIVGLLDEHWVAANEFTLPPMNSWDFNRGTHGYDPLLSSMGALFIANGRAFRSHDASHVAPRVIDVVYNVDVFRALATLLNVSAPANNGSALLSDSLFAPGLALRALDRVAHTQRTMPPASLCTQSAPLVPSLAFDLHQALLYRGGGAAASQKFAFLHVVGVIYLDAMDTAFDINDYERSLPIWQAWRPLLTPELAGRVSTSGEITMNGETPGAVNVITNVAYCSTPIPASWLSRRRWYQFTVVACMSDELDDSCRTNGVSATLELLRL